LEVRQGQEYQAEQAKEGGDLGWLNAKQSIQDRVLTKELETLDHALEDQLTHLQRLLNKVRLDLVKAALAVKTDLEALRSKAETTTTTNESKANALQSDEAKNLMTRFRDEQAAMDELMESEKLAQREAMRAQLAARKRARAQAIERDHAKKVALLTAIEKGGDLQSLTEQEIEKQHEAQKAALEHESRITEDALSMELSEMSDKAEAHKARLQAQMSAQESKIVETMDSAKGMSQGERTELVKVTRAEASISHEEFEAEQAKLYAQFNAKMQQELKNQEADVKVREADMEKKWAAQAEGKEKELAETKAQLAAVQAAHAKQIADLEAKMEKSEEAELASAEKKFEEVEKKALEKAAMDAEAEGAMTELAASEASLKEQFAKEKEKKRDEMKRRHAEKKAARLAALKGTHEEEVGGLVQLSEKLEEGTHLIQEAQQEKFKIEEEVVQETAVEEKALEDKYKEEEEAIKLKAQAREAELEAQKAASDVSAAEADNILSDFNAQKVTEEKAMSDRKEKEKENLKRRMQERKLRKQQNANATSALKAEHQAVEEQRLKENLAKREEKLSKAGVMAFTMKKTKNVEAADAAASQALREEEIRKEAEATAKAEATEEMSAMMERIRQLEEQAAAKTLDDAKNIAISENTEAAADDLVSSAAADLQKLQAEKASEKDKKKAALLRRKAQKQQKAYEKKMQSAKAQYAIEEADKAKKEIEQFKSLGGSDNEKFDKFRAAAQARHADEKSELEGVQMARSAQTLATFRTSKEFLVDGNKALELKEAALQAEFKAEGEALEMGQYTGIDLGMKELAPSQHEALRNSMAAKNADREMLLAQEAMKGVAV